MTNNETATTNTMAAEEFDTQFKLLQKQMKDCREQFKIDLQKMWDEHRAEMKALREKKAQLWADKKAEAAKRKNAQKNAEAEAEAEEIAECENVAEAEPTAEA